MQEKTDLNNTTGCLAQLVERTLRMREVRCSTRLSSMCFVTLFFLHLYSRKKLQNNMYRT